MNWRVEYLPEALSDLKRLDGSIRASVVKGILKVSQNPGADEYGKPLGNRSGTALSGLMKIKFKGSGIRVVYKLVQTDRAMRVIVISARADDLVYELAAIRREKHML